MSYRNISKINYYFLVSFLNLNPTMQEIYYTIVNYTCKISVEEDRGTACEFF